MFFFCSCILRRGEYHSSRPAPVRGASRASSRCGAGCGWPPRCRALDADDLEIRSTRTGADAGNTGGRSKCMSGRQLARTGRVGASDNPRDMEQAAKSIRVRNAGVELLPRLFVFAVCFAHTEAMCSHIVFAHGAAGAVKRPVVPHALSGQGRQEETGKPCGRSEHGVMTCVYA